MLFIIILGAISLVAVGATVVQVFRDGYGRVPDRPVFSGQAARDELLERGFSGGQRRA